MKGTPKLIVIEVGPVTSDGASSRSELAAMDRQLRDDLDAVVRRHLRVGARSKAVRTTMKDAEQ